MAELRVYMAASVDGFIATPDGGVKWLDAYNSPEFDFPSFFAGIGTVVVGRKTFDQSLTFPEWPYGDARVIVQTRRPLPAPRPVETFGGDVRELARDLRSAAKDTWIMGGGESLRSFLEHDLVDRWDLWVIPVLLGAGVPLFPAGAPGLRSLVFESTRGYRNGVVRLSYRRGNVPRTPT